MARILLIDDDADLVAINRAALEAGGHAVAVAYSAAEGWELAARDRPDLLVLDVMMEHFEAGFDLARRIAREYPRLPLIMLTAVDEFLDGPRRAAQDHDGGWMPVHRFMEKPVAAAVLLYEIEAVLHEVAA